MSRHWIIWVIFHWCIMVNAQTTPEGPVSTAGYRFRYFVRDDSTGDIKEQSEVRQGNDVHGQYALAEPNGGTRVVTYTAGKDTGFKARVQVHPPNPSVPPLPINPQPNLGHLMRIPPRNIYRTGFPPLEIKVLPPSATQIPQTPQVTQKPPYTPEEEQVFQGQQLPSHGYSEQNFEIFPTSTEAGKGKSETTIVNHDQAASSTEEGILNSTTPKQHVPPCPISCNNKEGEEERGRIKQEGDQVQLEMEQVIRTEMKDPEGVNVGTPYQNIKPSYASSGIPPLPFTPFKPDVMTPIYMKPLYMRSHQGPNAQQWPPIVNSGGRLYIPHIVADNNPQEAYPSKVYLVPLPMPFTLSREDLMSLAFPWEGKTPIPKEELSAPYAPDRPRPNPAYIFPHTYTYLLLSKNPRQQ